MSEKYGFVYLLSHPDMPDVYKVGCSERSPNARLAELNSSTSIPRPFILLCAIEVADPFGVEAKFHRWLKDKRISNNREFFRTNDLRWIAGLYRFYDDSYAFIEYSLEVVLYEIYVEKDWDSVDLIDPYAPDEPEETGAANDEGKEAA